MTYAIIKVGGRQYRVRAGERLLVDRLSEADGATFSPAVLLVGGDGAATIAPTDVKVTARVLGAVRGPKIRIGKYRKRTGYRRHTGFRAALTQIEIESIGTARARVAKRKAKPKAKEVPAALPPEATEVPAGYDELTVVELRREAGSWDADVLRAALAYERAHGKRKGAIAALESALAHKEEGQ
jgi:large subunit ribosomal protein L21